MKKLSILALMSLYAVAVFGQGTQADRIKGAVFLNRAIITITGATPDVSKGNLFVTGNTGTTPITNFTGGIDTQEITVNCGDTFTSIVNGSSIVTASGTNFSCTTTNLSISFFYDASQVKWIQRGGTGSSSGPSSVDDLDTLGPNPYYDLRRYGLYAGTGAAITCSTTASSASVSCPGGVGDFAIGQGIEIPNAGVASTFPAWGTTAITSYARAANVATYAYIGFVPGAGQTITISGLSDSSFNGSFTVIANSGDAGTFTVSNSGSDLGTTAGSGTLTITSAQVVVTPAGILNGGTTYDYKVVLRGYHGELSVASSAGETTTGAATLGINSVVVSSCARTSGVATCTTSAAHNFQSGVAIDVEGTTSIAYNGAHQISSTPTGTTFTFLQPSAADDSGTASGGTAKVVAKNIVQWNMDQYAVLQSIVYRSKNGGAYSVVGVVEGMDGAFVDWGLGSPITPAYVPTTPPAITTNGILAARITNIVGTTLTLDTAASATASSQTSQHDNTPIVLAGCAAIGSASNGGGTLYVAASNPTAVPVFNSPLDLYHSCNVNQAVIALASTIQLNEPLIEQKGGITIRGVSPQGSSQRDATQSVTTIIGDGYPMIYFVPGSFGAKSIENIHFQPTRPYQSAFVEDSDVGGGNVVNAYYNNTYFGGGSGTMPGIIRGGFNNFFVNGGAFIVAGVWGVPEALQMTIQNSIGSNVIFNNLPYISEFDRITFRQHGMEWNDWGHAGSGVGGYMTINDSLMEDGYGPMVSFSTAGVVTRVQINNPIYADFLSGASTPFIQTGANSASVKAMVVNFPYCGNTVQPLFEGAITGVEISGGYAAGCTTGTLSSAITTTLNGGQSIRNYQSFPLEVSGTSQVFYPMDTPAAPTSVVVSAGGSMSIGSNCFSISAVDLNGGETVVGAKTCATTTGGNQTVTITRPTLPANAVGWFPYGNGGVATTGKLGCFATPQATLTYVYSVSFTCTNTLNPTTTAGRAALGGAGLSAGQYTGNLLDFIGQAAPANPVAGFGRLYFNTSTGKFSCIDSTGADCLSSSTQAWNLLTPGTNSTAGTYKSTAGTYDLTGVTHSLPIKSGTFASIPATCTFTAGSAMEIYLATDATAGQNFYFCTATNTWTQQLNSATSATAWSAVTAAANANAGTFSATGNTWDFTAVTLLKLRVAAGAVTTVNGDQAYDTTNKNWHIWANGVDNINLVMPASLTPVNGNCAKFGVASGVITVSDSGVACGAGGGVTSVSGTAPITSTGGLTPAIACAICTTNASALTVGHLVIGAGSQATSIVASLGTTTTVYHGNAAGVGSFGAVNFATDGTGIVAVVNGGTGTTTPGLVAGSNIAVSGTWPNQTVGLTGAINASSISGITITGTPSIGQVPVATSTSAATWQNVPAVTSVNSGNLSPLFTTSVATGTTTAVISYALSTTAAHTFLGNNTGSTAAWAAVAITLGDLPAIPLNTGSVTNILPVANGGTGTATPGLICGTNCSSITGTWPNQTINVASTAGTAWSSITASTLTGQALLLGAGASLDVTGGGTNNATSIGGVTASGVPTVGQALLATSINTAAWQTIPNISISRATIGVGNCASGVASTWWNTSQVAVCRTGTNVIEAIMPFADGNSAQIPSAINLPADWTGAIDVRAIFSSPSTSGTVIWNVATACTPITGGTNDDVAFNAAQALGTVTLGATTNGQWEAVKTGITTTGCVAKSTLMIKISRATDTAAGVANLKNIELTIRHNNTL